MIGWLLGEFGGYILAALASIGGVVAVWFSGRSNGKAQAERDALRDSAKRQERGREAVHDLRDADRGELNNSLRQNDDKW